MKINRAVDHLSSLHACMEAFLKESPYRLWIEEDGTTRRHTIRYATDPLPENVALIIGDCIHNMRASLDHIATEIVRRHNGSTKFLVFPFNETRDLVEGMDSFKRIMKVAPQLHDAILNQVRSIKSDNYLLWAMNKADNIDKHNLLIPVLGITKAVGIAAEDENGNFIEDLDLEFGADSVYNLAEYHTPCRITNKGRAIFRFNFAKDTYLDGHPIFQVLQKLIVMTQNAVVALEDAYFGSVPSPFTKSV